MIDLRSIMAARNNADWYAMMFDLRGLRYVRTQHAFCAIDPPPPYHSWMTTTDPGVRAKDVPDQRPFGIKDSFDRLALGAHGFEPLFAASWISARPAAGDVSGWQVVSTPDHLHDWEAAWRRNAPADKVQFPDAILARRDVRIWGRVDGSGVVAGAIANVSDDCVGISNCFGPDALATARALCHDFCGSKPVVGYERGADLNTAIAAEFEVTGQLRVWSRP
jgi:hypothetical protein